MVERLVNNPQLVLVLIGGWLLLFGLTGVVTRPTEAVVSVPRPTSGSGRLQVVPASQQPGSVSNQLQGAQSLQTQGSSLQEQSSSELQPNSGLSDFPTNNNALQ